MPAPPARPRGTARSGRPWRRTTARVVRRDAGLCHLCLKPGATTADHLTPVAHGGPMWDLANLAAAHLDCNRQRGARPVDVARAELQAQHHNDTTTAWNW